MELYTAEDAGGSIWYIVSRPGYGREDFKKDCLAWVKDEDGDVAPQGLDLLEWDDLDTAAVWILGESPVKGETWPTMAKRARFAEIEYVYPGEFVVSDVK